ncbi:MAG TPA: malate synthase G, partial [Chromatiales bacterium]|nr:malate synthase G [Chromatiales bacterium]
MTGRVTVHNLNIARCLYDLVADEIAPGTGIKPDDFWRAFNAIVQELAPVNQALLEKRAALQARIDAWHRERRGREHDATAYRRFLIDIGYLLPEGESFRITTRNVDPEIARLAGPQLVVPVNNARYALNAANARWGSLYDALYGTDMIPDKGATRKTPDYNPRRGKRVVAIAAAFLDQAVPLAAGCHADITRFTLHDEGGRQQLRIRLANGTETRLDDPGRFAGYRMTDRLQALLLVNHGLHIEIRLDPDHPVGGAHPAGIRDVVLESAITTIQDCEDSVAAVDAEDKTLVYRNWLGLMKGDLEDRFEKNGQPITRRLHEDRRYTAPDGSDLVLPGRSLMLVRNVGLHMLTDAVTTGDGQPVPEGFLDGMITSLVALHDLGGNGRYRNSRTGSIYLVKPKLHGPEEVAFTHRLFGRIEEALGLKPNTLKLGIMDEERRTTLNLKECIRAARERVIFIN